MLVLVLLLVVAALGLLIAALTTANTLWAWISVVISVVAAGLLVMDWVRNRRRRSQAGPAADRTPAARQVPVTDPVGQRPPAPVDIVDRRPDVAGDPEATSVDAQAPVRQPLGPQISRLDLPTISDAELDEVFNTPSAAEPVRLDPNVEPAEEATDATDLLVVSELADEVVVIDERPRYHLRACAWLGDRQTMPLPVSEARELGFTPCGHCRPDATLAASHRARR
ncbi:hypothetical protein GCM10029964_102030 [Kibdelosporangium lantanae]